MPATPAQPAIGTAPGRVNLIGEHVDYNGGRCLAIALSQSTTARLRPRDDDTLTVRSGEQRWEGTLDDLDQMPTWVRYVAGVFVTLGVEGGFDVQITSEVPVGAGLSSSAALECSVAVALDAALALGSSADDLVAACVRAEREIVGAPTGGLDQAVSVHALEAHALLLDFGSGVREQVPFDPGAHDLSVLVVDTRVSHELTDGGYAVRRDEAWEAARALGVAQLSSARGEDIARLDGVLQRRARHVVTEVRRVDAVVAALRDDDWAALGPLLDASHTSLRDDYEVSCAELDVACEVAREAGALGARMTGGGFGGAAIALVRRPRLAAVRRAVAAAFAASGWAAPAFFVAEPGSGARVLGG